MKKGYMVLSLRSIRELIAAARKSSKHAYGGKICAHHFVVLDVDILDDRPELTLSGGYVQLGGENAIRELVETVSAAVLVSNQITNPDAGKPEKSTTQDVEKSTTQNVEKSTTQEVVKNSQCPCRTKRTPANT